MYTNAQSISSKLGELAAVTQDLDPDIILLTESWCNSNVLDASLSIEGYRLETDLRKDITDTGNGIGGGLLVYSKADIKILPSDNYKENKFNQFCEFSILTTGENLNLILSYRPPTSGMTNTEELCELIRSVKTNTIMIGDINMPGIQWETETADSRGKALLHTVMGEDLSQMVSFPTHIKGNILDLLITNCADRIVDISDAGRLGRSDHCILTIEIECSKEQTCKDPPRYNWHKADMAKIKDDFESSH